MDFNTTSTVHEEKRLTIILLQLILCLQHKQVGLTLQGIRGTASWTDFSSTPPHTPMSRLGEFDNSFDMHADDRPAATPEVALEEDQEVAEQASSISLSNVSHKSDISEGLTPGIYARRSGKLEHVKFQRCS